MVKAVSPRWTRWRMGSVPPCTTGALAAGAAAIPEWALAQTGPVPRVDRIIDAHCHIFNADDIPIEGYAKRIIVPMVARHNQLMARFESYPGALRALIHALAMQMKEGAPDGHAPSGGFLDGPSTYRARPIVAVVPRPAGCRIPGAGYPRFASRPNAG